MANLSATIRGKLTDAWPAEIFSRVGEIAIAFSQLEWALFVAAKRVDGTMKMAEFAKVHQTKPFDELCKMIEGKSPTDAPLRAYVTQARELAKQRHDLIHGVWSHTEGRNVLFRVPRKGEPYLVQIDPMQFEHLRSAIRRVRNGLLKSSQANYAWPAQGRR